METMKFCLSCGIPLQSPAAGRVKGDYCGNCADEAGNLKPREEVQGGIAYWLNSFSPDVDMNICMSRAKYYMKAMPAWADK
ncbi:MAG: hypothetical protein JXR76_29705 [Deltaproteobacteria bacterium]|nr:hypothetical protein [Deltaproteobacteria bacterium]